MYIIFILVFAGNDIPPGLSLSCSCMNRRTWSYLRNEKMTQFPICNMSPSKVCPLDTQRLLSKKSEVWSICYMLFLYNFTYGISHKLYTGLLCFDLLCYITPITNIVYSSTLFRFQNDNFQSSQWWKFHSNLVHLIEQKNKLTFHSCLLGYIFVTKRK